MKQFPRVPFVEAEQHVEWAAHEGEILAGRARVERRLLPRIRRAAVLIHHHGAAPLAVQHDLAQSMKRSLAQTARFGYQHSQQELVAQRGGARTTPPVDAAAGDDALGDALLLLLLAKLGLHGPHVSPKTLLSRLRRRAAQQGGGKLARVAVAGVGEHLYAALDGWAGVMRLLSERADGAARDVVSAMLGRRARLDVQEERASVLADLLAEGSRVAHLETLLLVGEALNLGRTAGSLALAQPPRFAMRSEQLDRNTCAPCDELHGQTAVVGSSEFYSLMPPQGCRGGGRCRGVIVFADDLAALRAESVAARRE